MRKWLLLLFLLLSSQASAQQLANYFQVADTNPLLFVWETSTGGFVAPTTPAYQTYLATIAAAQNNGRAASVCAVNNNGGLAQIKVCNPSLIGSWATGQVRTVFGVGTGANGTWTITVDDIPNGLVTLQGSTFVAASSGTIGAASLIDTALHLYAQIDKFNRYAFVTGQTYFVPMTITAPTILSNPLAPSYFVAMLGGGNAITLPQANVVGSIPLGQPVLFYNTTGNAFIVRDMNLNVLKSVGSGQSIMMMLLDNGTTQGSWSFLVGTN